jgi:hypothetical protein
MPFGDGHLRAMLSGPFSVPVTVGNGNAQQATRGILRVVDTMEIGAGGMERQSRGPVLTIAAGSLVGLKASSPIAIDGVNYKVEFIELGEDRATQRVHVHKLVA